jgi:hypothetical protein
MSFCLFGMFVMTERIRELVAAVALCSYAVYTFRIILHVTLLVPLHVSVRGLTSWAGTVGPIVARVPSGLSFIPPHVLKKKQNKK